MAAALRQLLRLSSRRISGGCIGYAARPGALAPPPPAALGFRTYTTSNARPRYGVDDTTTLAVMRFLMTDKLGRRLLNLPFDLTIALGFACILHSVIFGQQKNPAPAAGSSTDHRHNSVRSA